MFNIQYSIKATAIALVILLAGAVASAQQIKEVKIADLEKIIAESKTPLLINFWATWCRPCIEEIPYFQEEVSKHKDDSLQLILVSMDYKEEYPDSIIAMAIKRKFYYPILWMNETKADYFCPRIDPKWYGALPASLFINNKTGYRKFFEEQLSKDKLQKEIKAILQTR